MFYLYIIGDIMRFEEFKFEDLPNIIAENNRLLVELKQLLSTAKLPTQPPSDLMDIHEAGEMLRLTKATMYSKVSKNELPYKKFGAKLFFSRSELTAMLKEGRVKSKSENAEVAVKNAASAMNGGARL